MVQVVILPRSFSLECSNSCGLGLSAISEDCTHMPGITIVLPLYSYLESSALVTVGEFRSVSN